MCCVFPQRASTHLKKKKKKYVQAAKALHSLLFGILYDVCLYDVGDVKWTSELITITKSGRFSLRGRKCFGDLVTALNYYFIQLTLIFLIKSAACLASCHYMFKETVQPKLKILSTLFPMEHKRKYF